MSKVYAFADNVTTLPLTTSEIQEDRYIEITILGRTAGSWSGCDVQNNSGGASVGSMVLIDNRPGDGTRPAIAIFGMFVNATMASIISGAGQLDFIPTEITSPNQAVMHVQIHTGIPTYLDLASDVIVVSNSTYTASPYSIAAQGVASPAAAAMATAHFGYRSAGDPSFSGGTGWTGETHTTDYQGGGGGSGFDTLQASWYGNGQSAATSFTGNDADSRWTVVWYPLNAPPEVPTFDIADAYEYPTTTPTIAAHSTDLDDDSLTYYVEGDTIIDSYPDALCNTFTICCYAGVFEQTGQSFAPQATAVGYMNFWLQRIGTDPGTIYAFLYESDEGSPEEPTGPVLATSDPVASTTIGTGAYYKTLFTFSTPYLLDTDKRYFACVGGDEGSVSAYVAVHCDTTYLLHGGNNAYYTGSAWSGQANTEIAFEVLDGDEAFAFDSDGETDTSNGWENLDGADVNPYPSGHHLAFTFPSALTGYWYRYRWKVIDDSAATLESDWSDYQTFTIASGETPKSGTDGLDLSVAEAVGVLVTVTRDDPADVAVDDTSTPAATLVRDDALDVVLGSEAGSTDAHLDRPDGLDVDLADIGQVNAALVRDDALDVVLTDDGVPQVPAAGDDDLDVDVLEEATQAVTATAADTADVTADDQAATDAHLDRADGLDVTVDDQATPEVQTDRADLADLTVDDSSASAATVATGDLLDLSVAGSSALQPTLLRADALDLTVDDTAGLLVSLTRPDTIDLTVDDTGTAFALLAAVEDTLDVALADTAAVLTALARADTNDVTLVETAGLLVSLVRADDLDVDALEQAVLVAFVDTADLLDVEVLEAAGTSVAIGGMDLIAVVVTDSGDRDVQDSRDHYLAVAQVGDRWVAVVTGDRWDAEQVDRWTAALRDAVE